MKNYVVDILKPKWYLMTFLKWNNNNNKNRNNNNNKKKKKKKNESYQSENR